MLGCYMFVHYKYADENGYSEDSEIFEIEEIKADIDIIKSKIIDKHFYEYLSLSDIIVMNITLL